MSASEQDILRVLMQSRDRISVVTWLLVRDTQAAEDIFQNVVIKALTKDVQFDHEGAVLSWAMVTARREAIDWRRRAQRESSGMPVEIIELLEQEWQMNPSHENDRAEALRACLERLPTRSVDLLRMRYFDGLTCESVARKLDAGIDAVYKRLSRVHQSLRECVTARLNAGEVAES